MMTGSAGGGRAVVELMDGNMNVSDEKTYRIERVSQSRALVRQESRALVLREAHALTLRATEDGVEGRCAQWWYDCRRGRMSAFGGVLRLIDKLFAKGHSERELQTIPGWISYYIADLFDDRGPSSERKAA